MPNAKPLKILVIGCGSIGRRHIRLLKEMGVRVEGVDTSREAGLRVSDEFGVVTYTELHHALERCYDEQGELSRWDGAIIATPNHLHADPAIAALAAGCGVMVEKPIATSIAAANCIIAAAEVNMETCLPEPKPLLVGYCLRYHPGYRRVKELINEGAIGKVRHASFWFGHDLRQWRPGTDYRTGYACKAETGGGILLDASHELDLSNWFFGQPQRVMAMVRNTGALPGLETEDLAELLIDYGEVQVSAHVDYLAQDYRRGCIIIGDKGTLDFNMHPNTWGLGLKPDLIYEGGQIDRDAMYRAELEHFLKVVRGEEQPVVTGQDGVAVLRLVEAAKRSSETGKAVNP